MDIYVVLDGVVVIGASAKLQGAELIRTKASRSEAHTKYPDPDDISWFYDAQRRAYDRMTIVNTELQDCE